MAKPLIILDSGHCEKVSGKQAPDGSMREWEFNNDMQYRLKQRLEQHGFEVYLTNPSPKGKDEIGLTKRTQLANNHWISKGRPNALFISLHANAYGVWSSVNGVEVFYAANASTRSKNCAKVMCKHIHAALKKLRPDSVNRGVKCENFTVIYKTILPAILIEYAFYTNKKDLVILKNNRAELCEATVKALCESFNITYKPRTVQPVQPNDSFKIKIIYKGKEGLNIREKASYNSKVVGQVHEGDVFTIEETKNNMGRLKSNLGWISLSDKYVKKV